MTLSNGSKYVGEFKNDMFNGTGIFTWPGGERKYIGDFKDGQMHGKGLISFKDELECEGEFSHGQKHGVITEAVVDDEVLDVLRDNRIFKALKEISKEFAVSD